MLNLCCQKHQNVLLAFVGFSKMLKSVFVARFSDLEVSEIGLIFAAQLGQDCIRTWLLCEGFPPFCIEQRPCEELDLFAGFLFDSRFGSLYRRTFWRAVLEPTIRAALSGTRKRRECESWKLKARLAPIPIYRNRRRVALLVVALTVLWLLYAEVWRTLRTKVSFSCTLS